MLQDENKNVLKLHVAEGARTITVPLGVVRSQLYGICRPLSGFTAVVLLVLCQGIAGSVAVSGEVVVIPDAYLDSRFDPSHDTATGTNASVSAVACLHVSLPCTPSLTPRLCAQATRRAPSCVPQ